MHSLKYKYRSRAWFNRMVRCFACGGPLRLVREGLYRCYVCGQLNQDRGGRVLPPTMKVYPSVEGIREAAAEGVREEAVTAPMGLSHDITVFIQRVVEALTPIKGYEDDRGFVVRALRVRQKFRDELTDVFKGKRKFKEWYNSTGSDLGKSERDMDEIIYNALEGLSEPEAIDMRNMFEHKLTGGLIR